MISGPLCQAARVLAEISRQRLADISEVDAGVIEQFERGIARPDDEVVLKLKIALEELGVIFIPEERALGAGVRLKFNRSVTRRLGNLENEGGPTGSDDIP